MSPAPAIPKIEFIALVAALMALNSLAIDVMLPALPAMGETLRIAHENERQLVISSYLFGFGLAQLFFGPISDRFGRRKPLIAGLVIYIVAAGLAALAPSFTTLLVLRVIQGLGAAATRVIAQSVVRDRFEGRGMAEVMSLVFMVFMVIPVFAPAIGQLLLFSGHWQMIFLFMAVLATGVTIWVTLRLTETLAPERRRELHPSVIAAGFMLVFTNRVAFLYGFASMFIMGALFGFINTAQQVYVDIYGLGAWFPVAFGFVALMMSLSAFLNSRIVGAIGMRRVAHAAILCFALVSGLWLAFSLFGYIPFWLFMTLFTVIMFTFGLVGSNMMALAMEPLGAVAGTASSVFGFLQTFGGAAIGAAIGFVYDGSPTPVAAGFSVLSLVSIGCVLLAENGRLFGVGAQYRPGNR